MLKSKQHGSDWSATGTFLRKPAGGWIHEDGEFQSGLSINYTVQYLGSMVVNTSMRTLQFNMRTQVTKEAIMRLAEQSGNVFLGKRRKTQKQVEKLLGGTDLRWAGEVNLSISVESLKISDEVGGMVILNHSLPSISFASGGDGATTDYIGYVAKDPVHGRACHVFECPLSSHFVLSTIGQAFELRYKMYLNRPSTAQPSLQQSTDTWDDRNTSSTSRGRSDEGNIFQTLAEVHVARSNPTRPHPPNNDSQSGIYSDVQELPPSSSVPPPVPSPLFPLSLSDADGPPLPNRRRGQELPAIPGEEEKSSPSAAGGKLANNPYDTMEFSTNVSASTIPNKFHPAATPRNLAGSGTYEEIDKVMENGASVANGPIVTVIPRKKRPVADPTDDTMVEEYSDTFISIRQSVVGSSQEDEIDLTPSAQPPHHDYSNLTLSNSHAGAAEGGGAGGNLVPMKKKPPKPIPFTGNQAGSHTSSTPPHPPSRQNDRLGSPKPPARSNDPPKVPTRTGDAPKPAPRSTEVPKPPARPDPSKPATKQQEGAEETKPSPPTTRQSYDNPYQLKNKPPLKKKPSIPLIKTKPGSYDDPEEVLMYKEKIKPKKPPRDGLEVSVDNSEDILYDNPEEGVYNIPEAVYDEAGVNIATEVAASPKFDDGIYMSSGGISQTVATKPGKPPTAAKPTSSVDPLGPLNQQPYFHGFLSRPEAEGLLVADGEYLIRESSKKPGQYVLTGMASGKIQHLLLMDKQGKVKSKDREFESVQHLIKYFIKSQLPLVIGNSQVFLKKPVVNAFPST